jgi:HK97 family phage major capsid protein
MKSIQALREQRQQLAREARNQLEQKGDRVWSKEDQTQFDVRAEQIEAIEAEITAIERVMALEVERGNNDVEQFRRNPANKDEAKGRALFAKLLREGPTALTREELMQVRNTMGTGTPSQGGYTVQSEVANELIDAIATYAGMRNVAGRLVTANGAPLAYPTSDGTGEEGEIVAENQQAAAADPSFGTVSLNTFKFGSKSIAIPLELVQDTTIDIIAMINKRVRDRIGRIQNRKFTVGTGSSEPFGITAAAAVGRVGATGQTTTVIYDDLVELVESIDEGYQNRKWMFSQAFRKVVRKLKDSQNRPIWAPSYEAGISAGLADELLGYPAQINNHMPAPAANAKSAAFGKLDEYMIRDAMEITLFRFEDSAYLSKGQIGFLAWARAGGNLLDTGAVKTYQNSAT